MKKVNPVLAVALFVSMSLAVKLSAEGTQQLKLSQDEITVVVSENGGGRETLRLTNTGTEAIDFNAHKLMEGVTIEGQKELLKELKAKRKGALKSANDKNSRKRAMRELKNSIGASWLSVEDSGVIEPGETRDVVVNVSANGLESGEHTAYFVVLAGSGNEEIIIPVTLAVDGPAKLKYRKIEVDDGFTVGTTGNRNHAANPGETVAVTVTLRNQGGARAHGLDCELTANDPNQLEIIEGKARVGGVEGFKNLTARFVVKVTQNAHPSIPPAVTLKTKSADGKEWVEDIYLGEPESFEYPMGLKMENE